MTSKQSVQSQTTPAQKQKGIYSEQYLKAFRKLVKGFSIANIAKLLDISEQDVRKIKKHLNIS